MRVLYYPAKEPEARQGYELDWAPFLADGETITDSTWTVVGGDKGADGLEGTITSVTLEPDPAQADQVTMTNTVTTDAGGLYVQVIHVGLAEPITLEFVKRRLAVTSDHRDEEIAHLISAARFHVEDYTGLTLTRRQVVETLDAFGPMIVLRTWPVISIDSVRYLDTDEVEQEVVAPRGRLGHHPARLFPPADSTWPLTAWPGEIIITMTAGLDHKLPPGEEGAIPPPLVTAMLLLIGHWLENKETVLVGTIATDLPHGWMALCRPHRIRVI
jgi:uncharacterized phiE125 gp8 family phage protein